MNWFVLLMTGSWEAAQAADDANRHLQNRK
jgi:hypothetical protein